MGERMKVGIIIGSIRDGRRGEGVGRWVHKLAQAHGDADYELIDLKTFNVPLLTSAINPMNADRSYESPAVQRWSETIDACDAYVFVTPEYNHGVPGAFKNAVDSLGPEWLHKVAGVVSYGSVSGVRAAEHWRQILVNFHIVVVRHQVVLSIFNDVDADGNVANSERLEHDMEMMLDQVIDTSKRLKRS